MIRNDFKIFHLFSSIYFFQLIIQEIKILNMFKGKSNASLRKKNTFSVEIRFAMRNAQKLRLSNSFGSIIKTEPKRHLEESNLFKSDRSLKCHSASREIRNLKLVNCSRNCILLRLITYLLVERSKVYLINLG